MKHLFAVLFLLITSGVVAEEIISIGGETYRCDNECIVDLGPPISISDSRGGRVWKLMKPGDSIGGQ